MHQDPKWWVLEPLQMVAPMFLENPMSLSANTEDIHGSPQSNYIATATYETTANDDVPVAIDNSLVSNKYLEDKDRELEDKYYGLTRDCDGNITSNRDDETDAYLEDKNEETFDDCLSANLMLDFGCIEPLNNCLYNNALTV